MDISCRALTRLLSGFRTQMSRLGQKQQMLLEKAFLSPKALYTDADKEWQQKLIGVSCVACTNPGLIAGCVQRSEHISSHFQVDDGTERSNV